MKFLIPLVVLLSLSLQGCFSNKNSTRDDAVFVKSIPACNSPELCTKMWAAAEEWVEKYSPQGFDVVDDKMIRSEDKELGSDDMEITITKVKQSDGSYQIVIDNACTNTFGACSIERNNMLAFNKHLIALLPVKEKEKKEQVFNTDREAKAWLKKYIKAYNDADIVAFSELVYFPVTVMDDDSIQTLKTVDELALYLKAQKAKLDKVSGGYIALENLKVYSNTARSLFIQALFSIGDEDNAVVSGQNASINLIKIDDSLKMISLDIQS